MTTPVPDNRNAPSFLNQRAAAMDALDYLLTNHRDRPLTAVEIVKHQDPAVAEPWRWKATFGSVVISSDQRDPDAVDSKREHRSRIGLTMSALFLVEDDINDAALEEARGNGDDKESGEDLF